MPSIVRKVNIPDNFNKLIINAYSLDASTKELNDYLIQDKELINLVIELKTKNNIQELVIALRSDQESLFQDNGAFTKIVLDDRGYYELFKTSSEGTILINISDLARQLGSTIAVSVKGPVNKPGIYLCPPNLPLTEVIYEQAGGLKKMLRKFKALLLGGSFGLLIPEKDLDKTIEENGNTLIVLDDTSCIVNLVKLLTLYNYQKLSKCANCKFCQLQLQQAKDLLESITLGHGTKEALEKLHTIVVEKEDKAACQLGKQALLPLETAFNNFGEEFTEHALKKYCRASTCEDLFLSPCANACPASVDFPGTIALMQKDLFVEAVALGRETNPFFLSCGRICEEPLCQKHCQRQTIDGPVNSPALHRYAGEIAATRSGGLDKALNHPSLQPIGTTDKKIAVIGAGPGGLSAAYFLARLGHKVTIFEKLPVPGGMMRIGIPDYRLPPALMNEEINHILSLGVEIKYNTELGKDIHLNELQKEYDAVYVAIGAQDCNYMDIPGEDLPGIWGGVDFLRKLNLDEKIDIGQKVIVVGGGNVAIDAARSALRLGAKEIKIIYRRSQKDMPAAFKEIRAALKEGIEIMAMTNPVEINSLNGKNLVTLEKMTPGEFDKAGRRKPVKTKELFNLEVDTVIMAIGQSPDIECLKSTEVETKWSQVQVDPVSFQTNIEGIFAGGDCVLGPATAVEAIGHGRKGALAIHKYLMADDNVAFTSLRTMMKNFVGTASSDKSPQQQQRQLEVNERIVDFREVEECFTDTQALDEMTRCICSAKTGL